jgi:DNA-binding GntR family transcriptional regulator
MRQSGRQSLADQAFTRLEELIVTLVLAPGMTLSENDLCDRLKIGRTPVREALQRLRAAHLVEIIPRFGIRIAQTNVEDQLLLLEVRREVERLVVSSAARRSTGAERMECRRMAKALASKEKHGVVEFLRYHHQVRRYIAKIARNPYAEQVVLPFYANSRRFYYLHYLQSRDIPLAAEYHARVIRAIARGDEAGAAAASDLVIDYAAAITRSVVDNTLSTQQEREPARSRPATNISRRKA